MKRFVAIAVVLDALILVLIGWTFRHTSSECIAYRLHLGPAWACAARIASVKP